MVAIILPLHGNAPGHAKVSNLQHKAFGNENITSSKVTVDYLWAIKNIVNPQLLLVT